MFFQIVFFILLVTGIYGYLSINEIDLFNLSISFNQKGIDLLTIIIAVVVAWLILGIISKVYYFLFGKNKRYQPKINHWG